MTKIKNILFDLDGTIYNGNKLINGANDIINILSKKYNIIFLSNNSSKKKREYFKKLKNFGINFTSNNIIDIYNSLDATIKFMKDKKIYNLYPIASKSIKRELKNNFNLKLKKDTKPDAVLITYDLTLNYKKLVKASIFVQQGSELLSTNIDYKCPIENDMYIPDCGSISKIIEIASNKESYYIGKPNKLMIDYLLDKYNFKREETIMIGDRIYTDVECAHNSNIKSILVLSGETTIDDLKKSKIKPSFVIDSVKDIFNIFSI